MRASAAYIELQDMELQNQNCLDWLCVDLQNTTK